LVLRRPCSDACISGRPGFDDGILPELPSEQRARSRAGAIDSGLARRLSLLPGTSEDIGRFPGARSDRRTMASSGRDDRMCDSGWRRRAAVRGAPVARSFSANSPLHLALL